MDAAIETVLDEYHQRSDAEMKQMRELPATEALLLPVGSGIEVSRCTRGLEFK